MTNKRSGLRALLSIRDRPEKTALAFALGVFVGFSPLLGLHIVLGLLVAFVFRLNTVAVMVGVLLNSPWVVIPFYGFSTWLGTHLVGVPEGISFPPVGFLDLLTLEFWTWLLSQWRLLVPAFVGSSILSVIMAMASYPLALFALRRYCAKRRPLETPIED